VSVAGTPRDLLREKAAYHYLWWNLLSSNRG